MIEYFGVLLLIVLSLLIFSLFKWRPQKGIWYRNSVKRFNFGHLEYIRNCYVIVKGKKIRGSFKVVGNKVLYTFNWKYHKRGIKSIEKYLCSFKRFRKHIPLVEQGSSEQYITIYILKIR